MAGKKNKNKQRQQQKPAANMPKTDVIEEAKPVTIEDVAASVSQAEFDIKKDNLLQQMLDEIALWEETKAGAEKDAGEAEAVLNELNEKKLPVYFKQ